MEQVECAHCGQSIMLEPNQRPTRHSWDGDELYFCDGICQDEWDSDMDESLHRYSEHEMYRAEQSGRN